MQSVILFLALSALNKKGWKWWAQSSASVGSHPRDREGSVLLCCWDDQERAVDAQLNLCFLDITHLRVSLGHPGILMGACVQWMPSSTCVSLI